MKSVALALLLVSAAALADDNWVAVGENEFATVYVNASDMIPLSKDGPGLVATWVSITFKANDKTENGIEYNSKGIDVVINCRDHRTQIGTVKYYLNGKRAAHERVDEWVDDKPDSIFSVIESYACSHKDSWK